MKRLALPARLTCMSHRVAPSTTRRHSTVGGRRYTRRLTAIFASSAEAIRHLDKGRPYSARRRAAVGEARGQRAESSESELVSA